MRRADTNTRLRPARPARRGGAATALTAAALALLVSGCSFNIKEELGLTSRGPDEFSVVKKKPLQMPEPVAELPEPRPGAASLVDPRPVEDAQIALTGRAPSQAATASAPTAGEKSLLSATKATTADPGIRKRLEEDSEESVSDSLFGNITGRGGPDAEQLDPAAEAERLAEEARKGKNPNLERASDSETQ